MGLSECADMGLRSTSELPSRSKQVKDESYAELDCKVEYTVDTPVPKNGVASIFFYSYCK